MNFGLLWIEAWAASLLWVAMLTAFVGRIRRRWVRNILFVVVIGIPLLLLGAIVFGTAVVKFSLKMIIPDWFAYSLSLFLAYLVGALLIQHQGRSRQAGLPPAAATWARGPLLLGWLAAVALGYMTLTIMDLAILARCSMVSMQMNALYIATSPAIVSDSQNAAPLYEEAFRRLKNDSHEDVQNPPLGNGYHFDPKEPATIAFLSRQTKTIALLREAAALPGCRFDQDLGDPNIAAMLDDLSRVREAANTLGLHADEELALGHTSSAISDVAAMLGMSRHIGRRPLIISALVGIGVDAIGNKTLQEALPAVTRVAELDALHMETLYPIGRAFQQAFRGEERFGLLCLSDLPENARSASEVLPANTSLMILHGTTGFLFRVFFLDLDAYTTLIKNIQDMAVQPYYKVHDRFISATQHNTSSDVMIAIIAPSLARPLTTLARAEATDACAQVALAMTRFRLDHGSLPARLDMLVPTYLESIPVDPFDGRPVRLVVRNDQWIIYSVGPDGIDDGGTETKNPDKGDILFTLKSASSGLTTRP